MKAQRITLKMESLNSQSGTILHEPLCMDGESISATVIRKYCGAFPEWAVEKLKEVGFSNVFMSQNMNRCRDLKELLG